MFKIDNIIIYASLEKESIIFLNNPRFIYLIEEEKKFKKSFLFVMKNL